MKSGTMRGDTSRHCGKREGWGIFESSLIVTLEEEGRTKRVVGRSRRRRRALCTDENKRKKAASRVKHAFRLDWE